MDKNLAALLREDARTIRVTFGGMAELDTESDLAAREVRIDNGQPKLYVAEQRKAGNGYAISPSRGGRLYTYVTHLPVKEGDTVIVPAKSSVALALVAEVDTEVTIEPNDTMTYSWVIGVVDMAAHAANLERNTEIEALAAGAMCKNLRRGFAQALLGNVDGPDHDKLQALLGAPTPGNDLA